MQSKRTGTAGDRTAPVNVLRGVVCLSVTALHFAFLLQQSDQAWVEWLLQVRPGVESFFVLSGFFLAASYRELPTDVHFSVPRLVGRRLLRLLLPYWAAVALVFLLPVWRLLVPTTPPYQPPAITDVLANLVCVCDLTGQPFALFTFWSLAALIQLHLLWAVTFWLVRWAFLWRTDGRHHARTLVVLQAICLMATAVSWWFAFGSPSDDASPPWRLAEWFVYAGVGSAAYWAVKQPVWRWVAAALGIALAVGASVSGSLRPVFGLATVAVLLLLRFQPLPIRTWVGRALAAIGNRSYSVYLVHGIVGYRVMTALGWVGVSSDGWGAVVLFTAGMVASVAAGAVFFQLVERPVLNWARSIRYRGEEVVQVEVSEPPASTPRSNVITPQHSPSPPSPSAGVSGETRSLAGTPLPQPKVPSRRTVGQ